MEAPGDDASEERSRDRKKCFHGESFQIREGVAEEGRRERAVPERWDGWVHERTGS